MSTIGPQITTMVSSNMFQKPEATLQKLGRQIRRTPVVLLAHQIYLDDMAAKQRPHADKTHSDLDEVDHALRV